VSLLSVQQLFPAHSCCTAHTLSGNLAAHQMARWLMQAPVDDKVALKEIHDTVRQYYELINSAFTFYPTGTSADVFHMGLNNFTAMLEDCKVTMTVVACRLSLQP